MLNPPHRHSPSKGSFKTKTAVHMQLETTFILSVNLTLDRLFGSHDEDKLN